MNHDAVPHTAAPFTKEDRGRVFPKGTPLYAIFCFSGPDVETADFDNLTKSAADAITKAGVWWDDKQVNASYIERIKESAPRTTIRIFSSKEAFCANLVTSTDRSNVQVVPEVP